MTSSAILLANAHRGIRPTHFSGGNSENAISPRFGAAVNLPRLNWTFRAFYDTTTRRRPLLRLEAL